MRVSRQWVFPAIPPFFVRNTPAFLRQSSCSEPQQFVGCGNRADTEILVLRISEKAASGITFRGKAKVGFCPLQAVSLQVLEAGTVTFSLARLPDAELKRHS